MEFNCTDNFVRIAALSVSACCWPCCACCAAKRDWSASAWAAETAVADVASLFAMSDLAWAVAVCAAAASARALAASDVSLSFCGFGPCLVGLRLLLLAHRSCQPVPAISPAHRLMPDVRSPDAISSSFLTAISRESSAV